MYMADILTVANAECRPAGIGNPAVPFGKIMRKEEVMDRTRKRNIYVSPQVNVADFRLAEPVFSRR
jgi:hypothetical protein